MKFSRIYQLFLSSAFVGAILVTFIAPRTIAWYFEPPVDIGINCRPAAEWAMKTLLQSQGAGALAGVLIGALATYLLTRRGRNDSGA